jgi:hypothetical protein
MRRTLALLSSLALALALAPSAAAQGAGDAPPPLAAQLTLCTTGADPAERVAEFTGSMPALAGTDRMAMRFELLQRRPGRTPAYRRVSAPGLGAWQRSEPGRGGFVFTKRVEALAAPATYRATVRFRWYDADGAVQRTVARRTPLCRQPDLRPQLRLVALTSDLDGVRATIANLGASDAGPFVTTASVDGVPGTAVTTELLAAGEEAVVDLPAPPCPPGGTLRATVDSALAVAESSERDNAGTVICAQ